MRVRDGRRLAALVDVCTLYDAVNSVIFAESVTEPLDYE